MAFKRRAGVQLVGNVRLLRNSLQNKGNLNAESNTHKRFIVVVAETASPFSAMTDK